MARKRNEKSKKNNTSLKAKGENESATDNDSMFNDDASEISVLSNVSTKFDSEETETSLRDDQFADNEDSSDQFEEIDNHQAKLNSIMEALQTTKSAKMRLEHYDSICKALAHRYCYDYLDNRRITLLDNIEHGLKRTGEEIGSAALLLSLSMITMSNSDLSEELFRSAYSTLNRLLMDPSIDCSVRSKCSTALSLGCFITDYGIEKIHQLLQQLLSLGFLTVKGHLDANRLTAINLLKANCLDMFSFLVSIGDNDDFMVQCLENQIDKLCDCLDSKNLELRVAAGECIALLYENVLHNHPDFEFKDMYFVEEKIKKLATDSQKFRSKKELRTQRSNFRQILGTIQGHPFGTEHIKFNFERLVLDSWKLKRYYDTFCNVLGSGMNLHLTQNELLRQMFDLGPASLQHVSTTRASKSETKYVNSVNKKFREKNRAKMRGKRGDFEC